MKGGNQPCENTEEDDGRQKKGQVQRSRDGDALGCLRASTGCYSNIDISKEWC